MAEAFDADVIVAGAGPTGLMAALLLVRSGLTVRILDKNPSAAKESRAFAVQARTMEMFQSLGLADAVLDRGTIAAGVRVQVGGKLAASLDLDDIGRDDTPFPGLFLLPQSDTEAILAEALATLGVAVERGLEVVDLSEEPHAIVVSTSDRGGADGAIRARYLIGADGAHSIVRKRLGLTFEGAPYRQTFLLADCRVDWALGHDRVIVFLNEGTFGIYMPICGQDYARVITTAPADGGEVTFGSEGAPELPLDEVERAFRRAVGHEVSLRTPIWTSRYRVHHRGVDCYRVGRAFVAGDAAHIHSPAGGQGMNTGLQDAANLAWKIARVVQGTAPDALLDSYDAERRPVGQKVLSSTDRVFSLATSESGWVTAVRDALVPVLGATVARSGLARARAFGFVSQLGIRYRAGPAVADEDHGWGGGPRPGQRAPDAAVSHRLRVFDLVSGYRFHLLALSREALDGAGIEAAASGLETLRAEAGPDCAAHLVARSVVGRGPGFVQAENGAVFRAYGLDGQRRQALYLIRPDGHVAWRAPSFDLEGCRAFLAGRFGRPVTPP